MPDPPRAVDLGVVQPKPWVAWGGEDVAAGVSTDPEVARGVHAQQAVDEVALHAGLEVGDGGVSGDQVGAVGVGAGDAGGVGADVAAQTAWVVAQAVGLRVGWDIGEDGDDGAEVDGHVLEGTGLDAAATLAGWEVDVWGGR